MTHAVAAALGLSALLMASALAFDVVKYLGAAYLIYLGIRTLLTRDSGEVKEAPAPRSFSRLFGQGYLVNLLNPKIALFFYAFLPQFTDPSRGTVTGQLLLFGALFVALACCTDSAYALLGSVAGRLLNTSRRVRQTRRFVTGGVYLALGVVAALAGTDRQ